MLSEYFKTSKAVERLTSGVAGSYVAGFAKWLREAGYSLTTVRNYLGAVGHFSWWATRRRLAPTDLDESAAGGFGRHLRCCRCEQFRCGEMRRAVARIHAFVRYLRLEGVIAPQPATLPQPADPPLLVGFGRWMIENRGVTEVTVSNHGRAIRELLDALGHDPSRYDAQGLRGFLLAYMRRHGRRCAQYAASSVRMFLRYSSSEGMCSADLLGAIPSVACWRLSALPRYLSVEDIERLVAACDRGRHPLRDRAILLLLYRLALRAGDILRLQLSDIAWHDGAIRVSGKGRRETPLPLSQEVGDALLDYIVRERPPVPEYHVFLRAEAPFRPLAGSTISAIVSLAMTRAGVDAPCRGAHVLRHSAATHMLWQGASLSDIGTILRHSSQETTALYAKVDLAALREIGQPWPEVASC